MEFLRIYGRVLQVLAPERWVAFGLCVLSLSLAGLLFLEPVLFGRVIDVLSHAAGDPTTVWAKAIPLLVIWGLAGLVGIGANVATSLMAERLAHRNRLLMMHRFFQHVLSLPLSFHGDTQSGRVIKVMLVGSEHLFGIWLNFFREHLLTFISVLVLLPLTVFLNWRLSILLMILVVIFTIVSALVISKTQDAQAEVEGLHTKLAGNVQDALSNVVVVQAFTRARDETRLFGGIVRQVLDNQFPVLNWWALVSVLTRASSTLCIIAIFVVGTWLNMQNLATVGEIVTFMGFANMLIGRMEGTISFVSSLLSRMPALKDMFEVLDAQSSVPESPNAVHIDRANGHVSFENVGFNYPNGPMILRDVSFEAPQGKTIALVGQTGAGKSTAMSLLQRLWDPTQGRVLLDGHTLQEISLDSLRRNIGVVFQDPMMFNRSIRENILVGRPEATEEEVIEACKMAEAHDFIMRQPQGYDTMVGERGNALSGGQKQRLAIARALLKDPPVLILDEATSALDAATEARVQKALNALMAGRTTFIIAHRLSTVRDADEILVFENGVVAERGNFEELVDLNGRFAELVKTQLATSKSR